MRNMRCDPDPGSSRYDYLDEHMPEIRLRAIKLRIERGTYNEQAAMPTVVDRIMKELHDETME